VILKKNAPDERNNRVDERNSRLIGKNNNWFYCDGTSVYLSEQKEDSKDDLDKEIEFNNKNRVSSYNSGKKKGNDKVKENQLINNYTEETILLQIPQDDTNNPKIITHKLMWTSTPKYYKDFSAAFSMNLSNPGKSTIAFIIFSISVIFSLKSSSSFWAF
jgi:hypothetical protein